MPDRYLTESAWKQFAKGKSIKEAGLAKALAQFERSESDPDEALKALDEVDKQLATLAKEHKADKDISRQLDSIEKAAATQRKQSERERKETKAAAADDEADSPALLTTKLIPLLHSVRKGETLNAMLAAGGREVAVLLSRQTIAPTRRKLLADYLAADTVKVFSGECVFQDNAHTFVLDAPATGLAKKIKAALLKQTDLRLKVRVRDQSGVVDDDGDETQAESPSQTKTTDGTAGDFEREWAQLQTLVAAALQAQHPESSKLRATMAFVQEKAEKGEAAAALKALTILRKLLDAPHQDASRPSDAGPALERALQGWRDARAAAITRLKALAVEAVQEGDPEARDVVLQISAVTKQLSAEPATAQQVTELDNWLANDDVVAAVDEYEDNISNDLRQALERVRAALAG